MGITITRVVQNMEFLNNGGIMLVPRHLKIPGKKWFLHADNAMIEIADMEFNEEGSGKHYWILVVVYWSWRHESHEKNEKEIWRRKRKKLYPFLTDVSGIGNNSGNVNCLLWKIIAAPEMILQTAINRNSQQVIQDLVYMKISAVKPLMQLFVYQINTQDSQKAVESISEILQF